MPGNQGNPTILPTWYISVIGPQEGVPLALPKMVVLNTGNTDNEHPVGTGGDLKGPKMGPKGAPPREESLMGPTEFTVWVWKTTIYIVMSTKMCFPVQTYTPLVQILRTQTTKTIYG